jgi:hypothetical protein
MGGRVGVRAGAGLSFQTETLPAVARPLTPPVPQIPPSVPPPADAPVPNLAIEHPPGADTKPPVTLDLGINHRAAPDPGLTFAPGSRYQLDNDRRWLVLPGVMVRVPLP